jgi:catechol 2,3-dioxygenase-like lactoylglutathione lyase family enzyme
MSADPAIVAHVGIAVDDLALATDFYVGALGWRLRRGPAEVRGGGALGPQVRDVLGAGVDRFRQVHLEAAGMAIELFEFGRAPAPGDRWRPGIFHLCVADPQLEARAARMVAAGGRRLSRVWPHAPGAASRLCYCADPSGVVIELSTHRDADVYGWR